MSGEPQAATWHRETVAGIVLALAGVALAIWAYLPALHAGFYFDDLPNVIEPPGVRWTAFSWEALRSLFTEVAIPRRFVANFTFALNHLLGGPGPRGYHAVNIAIHLAVGSALIWVCISTARDWRPEGERGARLLAAACAATLFLVHPLNTQAVVYVVQRMASLATLFGLLAFGCYQRARVAPGPRARIGWGLGCAATFALALGSKETALAVPLVMVTYELCRYPEATRGLLARAVREPKGRAIALGTLLVLALVAWRAFVFYTSGDHSIGLLERFPGRDFDGWERMLTELRVQLFYLGQLLWPAPGRLSLEHAFLVSRGLLDPPSTLYAGLFWLAFAAAALVLAVRRHWAGFPLLAYLELHLIESGPVNLELVFEHRMYFPMTMLALALALAIGRLRGRALAAAAALVLAISGALALAAHARNRVWTDPVAFFDSAIAANPGAFRPLFNKGTFLGRRGRLAEAAAAFEAALAIDPNHSQAHNQLANIRAMQGRLDDAIEQYRRSLELDPGNAAPAFNLARLLEHRGDDRAALRAYRHFIQIAPAELEKQIRFARERAAALERRLQ